MTVKIPKVWSLSERATLAVWIEDPQRGKQLADICLDSDQWFKWLESPNATSFRFEPADKRIANFTAYKETETDGECWHAYTKIDGGLHKYCIGTSQDLTLARLREVGLQMLKIGSRNSTPTKQKSREELFTLSQEISTKEVHLKDSDRPNQLEQLQREIQRLQDELAFTRQSYLIACQEHQEAIEQLRHQNQRLQSERDQMHEELNQLYARNGDLQLKKLLLQKESKIVGFKELSSIAEYH